MDIQLLKHDGVTPDGYETVVFTGSAGVNVATCGTAQVCPLTTDYMGMAEILAYPAALGIYNFNVKYGSVSQSASFNVVPVPPVQIRILSMPASGGVVGTVAAQPFTVQLLKSDGVTPLTGVWLTLAGPSNGVRLGFCNSGSCQVSVDSRGIATTSVTPLLPGAITLDAVYLGVIQSSSFTALGPPATLQLTAQPGAAGVVVGDVNPLTVQAVAIGGSGPGTGYVSVTVDQGSAIVTPCVFPCGPKLDTNGVVQFFVKAIAPGPIAITATWGALHQTANFYAYAVGDVMQLVSGPSGTAFTQIPSTQVFAIQVFGRDGVTPAPGKAVKFATSIGSVRFATCGASTCTVISDANGYASSAVTPLAEGVTTLTAYDGAANQAATFIAQDRPDLLSLVSVPAQGGFVGVAAPTPFSVRALLADGITAASGRSVTVSVTNGLAGFSACAGAATCTLITNLNGIITTSVVPSVVRTISLLLTDRTVQLSASFSVPFGYTIAAMQPRVYVAEEVSFNFIAAAQVVQGELPVPSLPVAWTGSMGFSVAESSVLTDVRGIASVQVTAGPLSAGASASITSCAVTTVCVSSTAWGVAASAFRLSVLSGAGQSVNGAAAYANVVAAVSDDVGHPVAGAEVTVYQTVTAASQACPARGRCPAAPVLASRITVLRSGLNGEFSVEPLTVPGVATQTQIALSAGTQAFATSVLSSTP